MYMYLQFVKERKAIGNLEGLDLKCDVKVIETLVDTRYLSLLCSFRRWINNINSAKSVYVSHELLLKESSLYWRLCVSLALLRQSQDRHMDGSSGEVGCLVA